MKLLVRGPVKRAGCSIEEKKKKKKGGLFKHLDHEMVISSLNLNS